MKQELLSTQALKEKNIYRSFHIYQENSEEPWSLHTNGFIGFLIRLLRSSVKNIMESPIGTTYESWYGILRDLNRIAKEVPYKTQQKIYKLINLLNEYDNSMVQVYADSLVKHHHRGGRTMRYRSRILRERNQQLVELDQKLSTLQKNPDELDQKLFTLQG